MQLLANGLVAGLVIGVLALGFQAVYLPTRVFAISLAGTFTLAPYVLLEILGRGGCWALAASVAIGASILVTAIQEPLGHTFLEKKGAGSGSHLVFSLGSYIVLIQVVALAWGNEVRVLRQGIDPAYSFIGVVLTRSQLIAAGGSLLLVFAFVLTLWRTRIGLRFRALAETPNQIAILGYNVRRLRIFAFCLAGGLAGASSILASLDLGFDPRSGIEAFLLAVVAVILGGRASFIGPALGGVVLGVIRASVVGVLSSRWQDAVSFLLLVLVLYLRPDGLFGGEVTDPCEKR